MKEKEIAENIRKKMREMSCVKRSRSEAGSKTKAVGCTGLENPCGDVH